jgi:hypothetical protein
MNNRAFLNFLFQFVELLKQGIQANIQLVTVQLLYVPQGQLGQSVVVVSHLQTVHYIHRVARAAHREGHVGLLRPIALVRHSAVVAASWP